MKNLIPQTENDNIVLLKKIETFTETCCLYPPLTLEELETLREKFISANTEYKNYYDWIIVMINNCVWKDTIARIPYEYRILVLPQCLKHSKKCKGEYDEFGLLCNKCGICSIYEIQNKADKLGMLTIVAEGSTAIAGLIENGKIDAVIGVGCMESLKKAFPLMVKHAIPGIAIPLFKDGCEDTSVSKFLLNSAMNLKSEKFSRFLKPDKIKDEVLSWFECNNIFDLINENKNSITFNKAVKYLCGSGKRWRPYLLTAVYNALTQNNSYDTNIKKLAIAIESFHKASLIHDDIEDNDFFRGGEETLHKNFNIPIALNIGDLLLGMGYKIITSLDLDANIKNRLLAISATAHQELSVGQGDELEWKFNPEILDLQKIINIYGLKTSPAFSAALKFGAVYANASVDILLILDKFSVSFGIAYQLLDDIEDFNFMRKNKKFKLEMSAIINIISKNSNKTDFKKLIKNNNQEIDLKEFFEEQKIEAALNKVKLMYEHYRKESLRSLQPLKETVLKRLLFLITGKILKDI